MAIVVIVAVLTRVAVTVDITITSSIAVAAVFSTAVVAALVSQFCYVQRWPESDFTEQPIDRRTH